MQAELSAARAEKKRIVEEAQKEAEALLFSARRNPVDDLKLLSQDDKSNVRKRK